VRVRVNERRHGVGGTRVLAALGAAGLARLPASLAAHAPDLVVLVHGGNDMLPRQPASATGANLARMIELIRARGAQVVMLGVPGPSLTLAAPGFYGDVAEAAAVPIDLSTLPDLMRDRSMKSDQVHFNAAGYARMAGAVEALLRESGALP
jgi:lysophospholipase L1-like esterase